MSDTMSVYTWMVSSIAVGLNIAFGYSLLAYVHAPSEIWQLWILSWLFTFFSGVFKVIDEELE